eukprot:13408_1
MSANALCKEIDNLCTFIEHTLYSKQTWNIQWSSGKNKSKRKTRKSKKNANSKDICWSTHISFTCATHSQPLQLQWMNRFVLSTQSETELLNYIKSDIFLSQSTQTNQQLYLHLTNKSRPFESESLNHKLTSDPHVVVKVIQMFLNRFHRSNTHCFSALIENESQWWTQQIQSNGINTTEWFNKCQHYSLSPSFMIKEYLKQKRVFLTYQISCQMSKKNVIGKTPKICTKFIDNITEIPRQNTHWKSDIKLRHDQYLCYEKWSNYAIHVHRLKYCKYLTKRCENKDIKLLEFYENENTKMYCIPNIEHVLSHEMCDAICDLCVLDQSLMNTNTMEIKKHSKRFERMVCRQLLDVLKIYNNEWNTSETKVQLMNEKSIRKMHKNTKDKSVVLTPDVLFSSPIYINNQEVNWMDAKCFFLSENDAFGCRQVTKSIDKYVNGFGNGAIVCCGFVESFPTFIENWLTQHNLNQFSVLVLDASKWMLVSN